MPRRSGGRSDKVEEIVGRVLGNLTMEQAAQHLDYELTGMTVSRLSRGKIGMEQTHRTFAEGFWQRFCEEYGAEITSRFGECTRQTVSDWFAEQSGFSNRYSTPASSSELTYEPVLDDVDVAAFRGAEGLPREDIEVLNEVMRAHLAALRKRRGLD